MSSMSLSLSRKSGFNKINELLYNPRFQTRSLFYEGKYLLKTPLAIRHKGFDSLGEFIIRKILNSVVTKEKSNSCRQGNLF
jgi:hypothetical protein